MNPPFLELLHFGYLATLWPARRRLEGQFRAPEQTQRERLQTILAGGARSAYGKAHCFSSIADVDEYRARVPIVDYGDLEPWIERIAAGEDQVLTDGPVKIFEPTSGSATIDLPLSIGPCCVSPTTS